MNFHLFAVLLVLLNVLSFLWSVLGVFSKHPDRDAKSYLLLQINSVILYVLCIYAAYVSQLSLNEFLIFMVIQLLCLHFFWRQARIAKGYRFSLAFSKDVPNQLIVVGLYKYVRHPFYMIYLTTYLSVGILTRNVFVLLFSFTMYLIYRKAATMEEGKFLASPLGEDYSEYIRRTGRFFPRLFPK